MDLWIRSQDRQELYLIKDKLYLAKGALVQTSVTPYEIEQHYEIRCRFVDDILGEYKSKEGALKVLDEIQDLLHPKYLAKAKSLLRPEDVKHEKKILEDINECGFVTSIPQFDVEPINTGIVVYNMPKE